MNREDLGMGPTPIWPYPGTIWRHRKHAPPDHWHEYMVIGVNLAGPSADDACQIFTCRDAETLEWWDVAGNSQGMWLYQFNGGLAHTVWRDVPTVVYKPTNDNLCLPWVRPLSEFLDGRFTEVKSSTTA